MDRLSHLLPSALRKHGLHDPLMASLIVHRAQEWLKKEMQAHADALSVKSFSEGVLTICAANPISLQECKQQSHQLMRFLGESGDGIRIVEVRVLR